MTSYNSNRSPVQIKGSRKQNGCRHSCTSRLWTVAYVLTNQLRVGDGYPRGACPWDLYSYKKMLTLEQRMRMVSVENCCPV